MDSKKHIVAVNAIIKSADGKRFLVLKRNMNEIAYPGKWCFPGGKLEKGERVLDTLKREVLEEAGLEIEDEVAFVGDFTFVRPDGHNVLGLVFAVKAKSGNAKASDDFDDCRWVTKEEFSKLDHMAGMDKEVKTAFNS